MNRIDRLFAIILMFQSRRRVRAVDLAERFEISERTVYRDVRALVEMGVPIVTLHGEGYELLDTFRLPPVMLTPKEASALFLAGQMMVKSADGDIITHIETALTKIERVLPVSTREEVEQWRKVISFLPAQHKFRWDDATVLQLINAIDRQTSVDITYQGYQSTDLTERKIDPYDLHYQDGAWYVRAYCHLRDDMRSFRVNRISALSHTAQTFNQRIIIPEPQLSITVIIEFTDPILPHVFERQHYGFTETLTPNRLMYQVHALDEIQYWVLGFGSHATVIAPVELKEWLISEAKTLIKNLT